MTAPALTIRPQAPADEAGVRSVEERAFGRPVEASIAEALWRDCPGCHSLVAVDPDGSVVGHILFSPVVVERDGTDPGGPAEQVAAPLGGMGLGPLAVLPERQRQGIGSALMEHGLAELNAAGCPFVAVVGHPSYYPRFGFVRASSLGLRSHWAAVPDEAWMALVLDPDTAPAGGVVRFRPEFDAAE